uniref:Uncharacterized protein n=1 Tax=Lepeophtheirus salmonis TaxID=72036 RepID=A0A0K2USF7_LEPSM
MNISKHHHIHAALDKFYCTSMHRSGNLLPGP